MLASYHSHNAKVLQPHLHHVDTTFRIPCNLELHEQPIGVGFYITLAYTFQCAAPITPSASSAAVSGMTVMLMRLVRLRLESLGLRRRSGFFGVCSSVMCGWWCSLSITRVSGC